MRIFLTLIFVALGCQTAAAQATCAGLTGVDFGPVPDAPTQILTVNEQPARSVPNVGEVPAVCQVTGYISSTIGFELHFPLEDWNGKYLMQGCGGFCGGTWNIERCQDAIARGYACVTTDLGHKSTPIDGKWAYNNLQAEFDFFFRATHATAVAGKAITEAAYGRAPELSYYRGCSTGGRKGLVQAQRFPADFDGIIVGAPAGVSPYGGLHLIWSALANFDEDGNHVLRKEQLPAIYEAAVAACDADDGLVDGLIEDPRTCDFDPASLQCPGGPDCLTAEEVAAVKRIYEGPPGPDGQPLSTFTPEPGSELNWTAYIGTEDQPSVYYNFGGEFFRYIAFAQDPGPTWKPEDFDFQTDVARMGHIRQLNDAADPDMRTFARLGGKMIAYHGWADQSTVPSATTDYFEKVQGVMGVEETHDFFRLYMVPGMNHCATGAGPSYVDYLDALERWVEDGAAPEGLMAYQPKEGVSWGIQPAYPLAPEDVARARPVFPYPDVARHSGGDPNDPANFARHTP